MLNNISELLSDVVSRCNKLISASIASKKQDSPKDDAKNRLKLVLMHDRTNLDPSVLEQMRDELVEVISKYVEIDKDALDLNLESETNTIALVASIPVLRAKKQNVPEPQEIKTSHKSICTCEGECECLSDDDYEICDADELCACEEDACECDCGCEDDCGCQDGGECSCGDDCGCACDESEEECDCSCEDECLGEAGQKDCACGCAEVVEEEISKTITKVVNQVKPKA